MRDLIADLAADQDGEPGVITRARQDWRDNNGMFSTDVFFELTAYGYKPSALGEQFTNEPEEE